MKQYPYPVCQAYDKEYDCYADFGCRSRLNICPLAMWMESLRRISPEVYQSARRVMERNVEAFSAEKERIEREAMNHEDGRAIIRNIIVNNINKVEY